MYWDNKSDKIYLVGKTEPCYLDCATKYCLKLFKFRIT